MSQEEIQLLKAEIQTLQTENRQLKEALMQAQASQAPSLVARLQEEIRLLQKQLSEYKGEMGKGFKSKVALGDMKPTMRELETQIARLKDRNQSLLVSLSPEKDVTSELIQDLGNKVLVIHEEMKQMARNYRNQIREASKQMRASQEAERTIDALVKTLEKQTSKLNLENQELQKHIEDSENAYAGVVSKLEQQLKVAKKSIEDAKEHASQLYEARLSVLETKLLDEQKDKIAIEEKLISVQKKLKESIEEQESLSKKLFEIRMQYAEAHQEGEEIKERDKFLVEKIEALKKQLESVNFQEANAVEEVRATASEGEDDPFRSLNIFEI